MTLPSIPTDQMGREYLRIAGGYNSAGAGASPAGGLDVDHAGNLATDGDVHIGGDLSLDGQVSSTLTFNSDFRQGPSGCDKTWSIMLRPGAGLMPSSAGAVAVYSINAHQKIIAIPFSHTTQESAAIVFSLPVDYDGSTLKVEIFWTCANSGLSGEASWKLYGPTEAASDGDSLNQTVGVGTGNQCQVLDAYQGQWQLHIAETSFSPDGAAEGFFAGTLVRAIDSTPFNTDALLLGVRISYT